MTVFAVIPVRPPGEGKSRLETVLDRSARAALTRLMFSRVLEAVLGAAVAGVIVVSRDAAILRSAGAAGAFALNEGDGLGLNEALAAARSAAMARGADALLVLPADLPCLDTADVDALLSVGAAGARVVIGPDAAGDGTNALLLRPPDALPFRFGIASFARHTEAARAAGIEPAVLRRPNLGFDVDTPGDLAALKAMEGGTMSPLGPERR